MTTQTFALVIDQELYDLLPEKTRNEISPSRIERFHNGLALYIAELATGSEPEEKQRMTTVKQQLAAYHVLVKPFWMFYQEAHRIFAQMTRVEFSYFIAQNNASLPQYLKAGLVPVGPPVGRFQVVRCPEHDKEFHLARLMSGLQTACSDVLATYVSARRVTEELVTIDETKGGYKKKH